MLMQLNVQKKAGIMVIINEYDKESDTGESFDAEFIYLINTFGFRNTESDFLIVCAGFMRILSQYFTDYFKNKIINLHPLLECIRVNAMKEHTKIGIQLVILELCVIM